MIYRPLFVPADREALDRAAIDRWFGPPPDDLIERAEWYRLRRMARDTAFGSMTVWYRDT